jgi:hypothetical protein
MEFTSYLKMKFLQSSACCVGPQIRQNQPYEMF